MSFRLRTYAEQVADHLRSEILAGRWVGELPGGDRLGAELGVNQTTVGTAIRQLEKEGACWSTAARVGRVGSWCRQMPPRHPCGLPVCSTRRSIISWDSQRIINHIVEWADNVARGNEDRRQASTKAEFVEGGTFGPVPC